MILHDFTSPNPSSPDPRRDWWVIMGRSHPKCNVLFLYCQKTGASGTVWDATDAEMATAAAPGILKSKFNGNESRIEVKENEARFDLPPADKEAVPVDRKWWVVEVSIDEEAPEYPCILVYCEISRAVGAVFDYTDAELKKAKEAILTSYRWDDDLRVQVMVEAVEETDPLQRPLRQHPFNLQD